MLGMIYFQSMIEPTPKSQILSFTAKTQIFHIQFFNSLAVKSGSRSGFMIYFSFKKRSVSLMKLSVKK